MPRPPIDKYCPDHETNFLHCRLTRRTPVTDQLQQSRYQRRYQPQALLPRHRHQLQCLRQRCWRAIHSKKVGSLARCGSLAASAVH